MEHITVCGIHVFTLSFISLAFVLTLEEPRYLLPFEAGEGKNSWGVLPPLTGEAHAHVGAYTFEGMSFTS